MAKIIDRLLLFLLTLAVIGSVGCLLLAAFGVISFDRSTSFLHAVYTDKQTAIPFIVVCFVALLFSFRLFYISIRPSQVNTPSIDQRTDYGDIRISIDTVENLALKAANRVRGVKDLRARINVNNDGLEIILRTIVDGESSIPALTEEIQSTVKQQIEEITGIPVALVSVFVANIVQTSHTFKSRVE